MLPKNCVYPYCERCSYADCILEEVQKDEINRQDKFDKNLLPVEPEVLRWRAYNNSERGKEVRRRYLATDKGKRMLEKKYKKYIESGKNAEKCRRYREKKKLEKLLSIDS